jgi:hypothetical protein
MTKFQAFCDGFWSAWDFTRPFDERPEFCSRKEFKFDYEQMREKLGLNKSVWESVGEHLYKAMGEDIDNHVRKQ